MNELTAAQIMLLGVVATIVVAGVNLYARYQGQQPGRRVIMVVLYVISIVLAYIWARPLLPPFPPFPPFAGDPALDAATVVLWLGQVVVFLGQLIAAAGTVTGFAQLVYNVLLKNVFDKIDRELQLRRRINGVQPGSGYTGE